MIGYIAKSTRFTRTISLKKNLGGFTIVELMIAMSVLSVLLLMATVIMIRIGALYSKGVNAADLQNANRNIINDISATIEFSSNDPLPSCVGAITVPVGCNAVQNNSRSIGAGVTAYAICFGTTRYSFIMRHELDSNTIKHVLWRDAINDPTSCSPLDLSQTTPTDGNTASQGYEMVPLHARLTRFAISETAAGSGMYEVDIWMAYGPNDLVNTNAAGHSTCNGGTGTEFCAVSELSTSVARRLATN